MFDSHQDDNMYPTYQELLSRNSQLPESISEPPSHLTFPKLFSVLKILLSWSRITPFWDFTFTTPRSSLSRRSLLRIWSFNSRSFM